jgi:hypothetical protein
MPFLITLNWRYLGIAIRRKDVEKENKMSMLFREQLFFTVIL